MPEPSLRSLRQTADQHVDLAALITRGLRAELNTQSFVTGQSQIDLDFDPSLAGGPAPGRHQPAGNPDAAIHPAAREGTTQPTPAA